MKGAAKAKVRLFARLRELAGARELEVELGEGLTAADVYALLARRYPALAGLDESLMYAVNAQYVPPDHQVRDGDEVALIPPVSGGGHAV
jgi:molybdopterin converting factor subunit 1